jgi:hypothetical protein
MMMDVLTLIGLGIIDALNPFSIGAMIYLLATPRPVANGTVFIVGTLLVYLLFGVAMMEGWSLALKSLLPLIPQWLKILAMVIAGGVCLGIAFYLYLKAASQKMKGVPYSPNLTLLGIFLFALGSTISDLPTAIPYMAAINMITGMPGGWWLHGALLVLYNLIYISPLIVTVGLYIKLGHAAQGFLGRVRVGIEWCFVYILPPFIALLGVYLLLHAVWMMEVFS